jgi:hypothetical protein
LADTSRQRRNFRPEAPFFRFVHNDFNLHTGRITIDSVC